MVRQIEAVFEDGVLRPVEPLALSQRQRVSILIDDGSRTSENGSADLDWLAAHAHEYVAQWVALSGGRLIAHGSDARAVRDEARRKGVAVPLMHRPEAEGEPQILWT